MRVTLILLAIAVTASALPNCIPTFEGNSYRISIDIARKTVYFENTGSDFGYFNVTQPTWDFTQMYPKVQLFSNIYVQTNPPPSALGFSSSYITNTLYLATSTNNVSVYGSNANSNGIHSYQIDFSGNACAGFGFTGGSNSIMICPFYSQVTPNGTCNSYDCYPCSCECSLCYGPGPGTCFQCNAGFYLQPYSYECNATCPTGYYQDTTDNYCGTCDPSCKTCFGAGNSGCTACNSGYYLQPNSTTCLSTCPSTNYFKNATNNICSPCSSGCEVCTNSAPTSCTVCNSGYYLQPSSTICLSTCPTAYFGNQTTKSCSTCNPTCLTCGPTSNNCTSCNSGSFLNPYTDSCDTSCPDGTYQDTINHVCGICDASCVFCTGSGNTNCVGCTPGYFQQPAALTTCLQTCPAGFWTDWTTTLCQQCYAQCPTCRGPTASDCTSCPAGYFLQPAKGCAATCAIGYYKDITSNVCIPCDNTCQTCSGPTSSQCITCETRYFLQPSSSSCSTTCPNGYWGDPSSSVCSVCGSSCLTCIGSSNADCTSCLDGYYLDGNSVCATTCPTGYYEDPSTNLCGFCDPSCATCDGSTKNDCSSCISGFYLQPNSTTCLDSCNLDGYFSNIDDNSCSACHPACMSCTGPTNANCTPCADGYFLQPIVQKCETTCSSGYYQIPSSTICSVCDPSCSECSGPDNTMCTACSSGYYLQPSSTTCFPTCPLKGYWSDSSTKNCSQCNPACASCTGPSLNDCIKSVEWSFFIPIGFLAAFVVAAIILKTINKNFCLLKRLKAKKVPDEPLKISLFSNGLIRYTTAHPVLSLFFYKDKRVSKVARAINCFARLVILFWFAWLFINAKDTSKTFSNSFTTFNGIQFIIPFFVLMPFDAAMDKTLRNLMKMQENEEKTNVSEGKAPKTWPKTVFVLVSLLTTAASLAGVILAILFSHKFIQEEQISWSCNILKLILQDWFLSPLVSLILNYSVTRCFVDRKNVSPKLKNLALGIVDQSFLKTHNALKECQALQISEQKFTDLVTIETPKKTEMVPWTTGQDEISVFESSPVIKQLRRPKLSFPSTKKSQDFNNLSGTTDQLSPGGSRIQLDSPGRGGHDRKISLMSSLSEASDLIKSK